jgi:hypothetical protein
LFLLQDSFSWRNANWRQTVKPLKTKRFKESSPNDGASSEVFGTKTVCHLCQKFTAPGAKKAPGKIVRGFG